MSTEARTTSGGGIVIAFPPRPDRLARALAGLLRATQEQAAAVAAWRGALAELDGAMAGLAGSMGQYQAALADAASGVDALGAEARRLEAAVGG